MTLDVRSAMALRLSGQGLLSPFASIEDCIKACLGIQTQYSQSLPVATAARAEPKPPEWFERALDVNGSLRKTWTVRWTLHTVHEDDIPLFVSAVGPRFYARFVKGMTGYFGMSLKALEKRQERVWNAVREGPLTRKELHDRIPEFKKMESTGWGWDVAGLAYEGRLYIGSHNGATTFVATEPPPFTDPAKAQAELLRRYLKAYGPATRKDFQIWSGLYMKSVDPAFEALEEDLEWAEVEGSSHRYALLRDSLNDPEEATKPKLLAKFDPLVMGYRERSLFLPEGHFAKVIRPAGQIEATILLNGQIAGAWRAERSGKRLTVRIEPFEKFGARTTRQLEKEADKVRFALGAEGAEIVFKAG